MNLPTPYEISRLAIALRSQGVESQIQAVREAIGMWFLAAHELEKAKAEKTPFHGVQNYAPRAVGEELWQEALREEDAYDDLEYRKAHPEVEFGSTRENSQAMKWLDQHGKHFKTFRGFEKAWEKVFGSDSDRLRKRCTAEILDRFVSKQIEAERKSDAERKRKRRIAIRKVSNKSR